MEASAPASGSTPTVLLDSSKSLLSPPSGTLVSVRSSRASTSSTIASDQEEIVRPLPKPKTEEDISDDPAVAEYHIEVYGPPPSEKDLDLFEVRFAPDDPEDPHNWSRLRRWYITMLAGLLVLNSTFASSAPTGIADQMMAHFGFGNEVATLTISLFVGGYCVGPLLWGPVSEQYGRKLPLIAAFIVYLAFQVGCALAPNTAGIIVFRFLSGMFAAAPLVISAALMSDVWDPNTRGKALGIFVLAPFAGPSLGPIVSGFMDVAGVSWRWTYWVLTIFAGVCLTLILLTLPETYTPTLLVKRAKNLRKTTGDSRWWAPLERSKLSFGRRVEEVVGRPFKIFLLEPMLIATTLYMSFIYGCVYLLLEAYPVVFINLHGFNAGISGLMFLPIFVGSCFGVLAYLIWWNPRYVRLSREFAPAPVPPEYRLEQAMVAAPIFAGALFWFGWTSYRDVSFWAPAIAGGPLGFSIVLIFLALTNYIVDVYLFAAASALAAHTVVRSLFGAGFPLFATQMYDGLNPRWASTVLGAVAVVMAPIPFVLKKYGPALRRRSRYAPTVNAAPSEMQPRESEAA